MRGYILKMVNKSTEFSQGIEKALPIFMGYFSIATTFGIIAKSVGLPGYLAVLMSMTNYTGATQFISINMLVSGISVWNILLTTLMINARYFLMAFCIAEKFSSKVKKIIKQLLAFGITDEVFVLAMTREKLDHRFLFGSEIISWIGWVTGTLTGVVLAEILPESISSSTGIAIYIMFLGLILPVVKKSKKIAIVTGISILISSLIYYIPQLKIFIGNCRIIFTIIIASVIGAILFPIEENGDINEE